MPIRLTPFEKRVARQLAEIKKNAGSHSPSPAMLAGVKGIAVKHDFCYLSNPHATKLFLKYAKRDFAQSTKLWRIVEYYPSQNRALAQKLSNSPLLKGASAAAERDVAYNPRLADLAPPLLRGIGAKNIFVGNGATEIIQAVLQNIVGVKLPQSRRSLTPPKLLVPVPTFSPYLEFAPEGVQVVPHQLSKENDFRLNLKKFVTDVAREKPDTVIIISPNNPEGGFVNTNELQGLLPKLRHIPTVIIDESFLHFTARAAKSVAPLVKKYPNLIVIKSLSKDFGIAGLRLGYAVMSEERVSALLRRGYLWNVSGFGEYFLDLLNRKEFLRAYEKARLRAIRERDEFFIQLSKIKGLRVYPSRANMFLLELTDGSKAEDLTIALLVRHGIYVRLCKDKVGLTGEFVRVASRTTEENSRLAKALTQLL